MDILRYKKPVSLIAAFFMLSILVSEFVQNCMTLSVSAPSNHSSLAFVDKNTHSDHDLTRISKKDCKLNCITDMKLDIYPIRHANALAQEDTQPDYYVLSEKLIVFDSRANTKHTFGYYYPAYFQTLERNHVLRI